MTYLFRIIILFLNQLVHSIYIVLTQYRTRSTIRSTYTPLIPAPFSLWTRSKERNSATHARSHSNPPITKDPAQYETRISLRSPNDLTYSNSGERIFDQNFTVSIFRLIERSHPPSLPPIHLRWRTQKHVLHLSSSFLLPCIHMYPVFRALSRPAPRAVDKEQDGYSALELASCLLPTRIWWLTLESTVPSSCVHSVYTYALVSLEWMLVPVYYTLSRQERRGGESRERE